MQDPPNNPKEKVSCTLGIIPNQIWIMAPLLYFLNLATGGYTEFFSDRHSKIKRKEADPGCVCCVCRDRPYCAWVDVTGECTTCQLRCEQFQAIIIRFILGQSRCSNHFNLVGSICACPTFLGGNAAAGSTRRSSIPQGLAVQMDVEMKMVDVKFFSFSK
jgi:hypothetical protein